jgi:hypothetical protein
MCCGCLPKSAATVACVYKWCAVRCTVVTLSRLAAAVTCNEEIVRFTSLTDAQLALQALPSVVMADAVSGFELEWTKRHAETSSVVTALATRFVATAQIISGAHTVSHPMHAIPKQFDCKQTSAVRGARRPRAALGVRCSSVGRWCQRRNGPQRD